VFRDGEATFATPWLELRKVGTATITRADSTYMLQVTDQGELTVTDTAGAIYPFYFEMWFSAAVQHGASLVVVVP